MNKSRSRSKSKSKSKTRKINHNKLIDKVIELPDDIQIEIMSNLKPTKLDVFKMKINKIVNNELPDISSRSKNMVKDMFELNKTNLTNHHDYNSYMNHLHDTYKYYNNNNDTRAYHDINGRHFKKVYKILMIVIKYCDCHTKL